MRVREPLIKATAKARSLRCGAPHELHVGGLGAVPFPSRTAGGVSGGKRGRSPPCPPEFRGGVGGAKPPPPTPIQKGAVQKGLLQKGRKRNGLIQKSPFGIFQNTIQNTSKSKGPGSAYRATLYGKSHYRIKWEVAMSLKLCSNHCQ